MRSVLFGVVLGVGACAAAPADVTDAERAVELWDAIADRDSWSSPTGWEGVQPSNSTSPHTPFVDIRVNTVAEANVGAEHDDGAILTKDVFADVEGTELKVTVAMQKIAGFDPEHGDWFWAYYDPADDGVASPAGAVESCYSCHSGGTDYSFVGDLEPGTGS